MAFPREELGRLWGAQRGWLGRDLDPSEYVLHLPAEVLALAARGPNGAHRTEAAASLASPRVRAFVRDVETRLEGGLGFVVLKGLSKLASEPHAGDSLRELSELFGGLVSQTSQGTLIARIENEGGDLADAAVRGHKTNAELAYHCDRADRVAMLCVRAAASGGETLIASSIRLYEDLRARFSHHASTLGRPVPQDRRGEEGPGEAPWCAVPVFSSIEGAFVCRYVRRFITDVQRHPEAPHLGDDVRAAIDAVDALLAEPDRGHTFSMHPADLVLLNNNVVLHGRARYRDPPGASRRLLLRAWLSHRSARPLSAEFAVLYGNTHAGSFRGGVWPT